MNEWSTTTTTTTTTTATLTKDGTSSALNPRRFFRLFFFFFFFLLSGSTPWVVCLFVCLFVYSKYCTVLYCAVLCCTVWTNGQTDERTNIPCLGYPELFCHITYLRRRCQERPDGNSNSESIYVHIDIIHYI